MKIRDILKETTPHISFEVFPPKTEAAFESVLNATDKIAALNPSYISVTYGAGGGTSANTVNIAAHIKDDLDTVSLAHLTCVSSTREHVHKVIDELKERGIENILALRGDIPKESEFPLPRSISVCQRTDRRDQKGRGFLHWGGVLSGGTCGGTKPEGRYQPFKRESRQRSGLFDHSDVFR